MKSKYILSTMVLLVSFIFKSSILFAEGYNVRGVLNAVNNNTISVKSSAGKSIDITLSDQCQVVVYKDISLVDIPKSAYISMPTVPAGENKVRALGVNVFPKKMRGFNEGSVDWDLGDGSKVTNATLDKIVPQGDNSELVVRVGDKSHQVQVTNDTPVTMFEVAPGYKLKKGQLVVVNVGVVGNKTEGLLVHVRENGKLPPI